MLFKDKRRKLLAGIDLNDQYSQISFIYTDRDEPVTVSTVTGKEQYNVPTVLCKRQEVNQWFYGKEALRHSEEEAAYLVKSLLRNAYKGDEIIIEEEHFSPIDLLALFIRRVLGMMQNLVNNEKPDGLMITVDTLDHRMIEVLSALVLKIGIETDRVFFQSHLESFYQFTIHQSQELWVHDVVVFDFSGDYMKTYRLEMNRRTSPIVTFLEEREFRTLEYESIPAEEPFASQQRKHMDEQFAGIVEQICEGHIITTCYLLGDGFLGNWCDESLKKMYRNRRVFQGNNLYSKGACYTLIEKFAPTELSGKYIFLGKDKVKANIGMITDQSGRQKYYPVMDAGVNWYDAKKSWDILLEDENKLRFIITPLNNRNRREAVMTLENINVKEDMFTRVRLSIEFLSQNHFTISAHEMGFGEFLESQGTEWKEDVTWED